MCDLPPAAVSPAPAPLRDLASDSYGNGMGMGPVEHTNPVPTKQHHPLACDGLIQDGAKAHIGGRREVVPRNALVLTADYC